MCVPMIMAMMSPNISWAGKLIEGTEIVDIVWELCEKVAHIKWREPKPFIIQKIINMAYECHVVENETINTTAGKSETV